MKSAPALKIIHRKNNYTQIKYYLSFESKLFTVVGMSKAGKSEVPKLVLEPSDEWRTVEREKAAALARALADPVRRAVLQLLDHGPIRQFELAQAVSQALGKRYGDSLLRYHLRPLERAGLIGFEADPKNPRAKLVYRKADFRIQVLPREKPVLRIREPRTTEEFVAELREALKKEGE